ncbi:MAG: efflux RND transporter periplasmic adaptor subunit [Fusobacteriaceae bacterium]
MKKKYALIFIIGIFISILSFNAFKAKKVAGIKVEKKDYTEKILVTGTVQGKNYSKLGSEFSGTIHEIYKREGEVVKKGEILAKLNTEEIQKNIAEKRSIYEKAKSDFENLNKEELNNAKSFFSSSETAYITSKSEFEKYSELYEKKYINQLEYNSKKNQFFINKNQWESAKTRLNSLESGGNSLNSSIASVSTAKNSLEGLEKRMEKYFIRAPFDGYVTKRIVEIGESVAPYSEMFEFSSLEEKIVVINLDEKYIGKVNIGNNLKIFPYGNSENYSFGKIYFKGIDINQNNGTLEIKTTIENQLPEFLYNSTINGIIEGRKISDSFFLEERFIVYKNEQKFVFVLKDKKSELKNIEGISVIDGFIVTNGLETDEIILEPKDLEVGIKVKVSIN